MKKAVHSLFEHNLFIVWIPEYELGIPIVDEQHRGIISTINSLYYGMMNKHAEEMLEPTINMMHDYTRTHFQVEEEFLEKCKYPGLADHQALHLELTNTLSTVGRESMWHKDPREFLMFLKKWWIDHICDKDRVFLEYLLAEEK